jgi:hypothetical protein
LLKKSAHGNVCGLDYSKLSVKQSVWRNRKVIRGDSRADIRFGSVSDNPWPDIFFDIFTAF